MSELPYSPPVESGPSLTAPADLQMIQKKVTFWFAGIWISIGCIWICPTIGLFLSEMGMRQAFSENSKIANPEQLAAQIGEILIATTVGLLFCVIGIPPLIISIIQHRKWKKRLIA